MELLKGDGEPEFTPEQNAQEEGTIAFLGDILALSMKVRNNLMDKVEALKALDELNELVETPLKQLREQRANRAQNAYDSFTQ